MDQGGGQADQRTRLSLGNHAKHYTVPPISGSYFFVLCRIRTCMWPSSSCPNQWR